MKSISLSYDGTMAEADGAVGRTGELRETDSTRSLLRKINKVLDLGFVRGDVAGFYGSNGNVSVDPVIIIKLMLLLFLDDVRSERELMRIVPLRLDYLWFLGYGLEDEIPNHSVLSKARKRWGAEVFERLFARSVEQCVAAGLVDGSKLYVDGSLVAANASRNSVIEVVVRREVGKLDEREEEQDSGSGGSVQQEAAQHHRSGLHGGAPPEW